MRLVDEYARAINAGDLKRARELAQQMNIARLLRDVEEQRQKSADADARAREVVHARAVEAQQRGAVRPVDGHESVAPGARSGDDQAGPYKMAAQRCVRCAQADSAHCMVPDGSKEGEACQACKEAGLVCQWPAGLAHPGSTGSDSGNALQRAQDTEALEGTPAARTPANPPAVAVAAAAAAATPGRARPRKRQRTGIEEGDNKARETSPPPPTARTHHPILGARDGPLDPAETTYRGLLIACIGALRLANAKVEKANQLGEELNEEFAKLRPAGMWQPGTDPNGPKVAATASEEYFREARNAMAAFEDLDFVFQSPSEPEEEYSSGE